MAQSDREHLDVTDVPRFDAYDHTPLFNIKAVVQQTGLSRATLRAWERRYTVCTPQRTETGYRLYSARDVARLLWLKEKVDAGMSISRAAALLKMLEEARADAPALLAEPQRPGGPIFLEAALLQALLSFDEAAAEQALDEAFALYSLETVVCGLMTRVLGKIGERWERNEVSPAVEHFASGLLRRRLFALLDDMPAPTRAHHAVVGCAPGNWHEISVLQLALLLRRRGWRVTYLGQNVAMAGFLEEIERLQPHVVCLSAYDEAAVATLRDLAEQMQRLPRPRPILGFGGPVFNQQPAWREDIAGTFLGEKIADGVDLLETLVA